MYYLVGTLGAIALVLQVINVAFWNRFWPFFTVLFFHLVAAIAQLVRMVLLTRRAREHASIIHERFAMSNEHPTLPGFSQLLVRAGHRTSLGADRSEGDWRYALIGLRTTTRRYLPCLPLLLFSRRTRAPGWILLGSSALPSESTNRTLLASRYFTGRVSGVDCTSMEDWPAVNALTVRNSAAGVGACVSSGFAVVLAVFANDNEAIATQARTTIIFVLISTFRSVGSSLVTRRAALLDATIFCQSRSADFGFNRSTLYRFNEFKMSNVQKSDVPFSSRSRGLRRGRSTSELILR